MKGRNSWVALAMAFAMAFGVAMSASASDESKDSEHRQILVRGRQTVWVNPSEKPYALTGEQRRQHEQDRAPDFEFHGRAGIQYR